jgi:hypothetical protein
LYCDKACQKIDWKKQHKQICKLLNVGHGGMQLRSDRHVSRSIRLKEQFEIQERSLDEHDKRFFKLFTESTFEGSQAAARKMKKIAKRQTKNNQEFLLFHSLLFLVRFPDSKMLSWPSSPLLVMLQLVDPNVLTGGEQRPLQEGETRMTPLHFLADLADHSDYFTHENQLMLAKQLIKGGANVNAASIPDGETPLHRACHASNVTNLDFVELLLKKGANPNAQDHREMTPLMGTIQDAPGAAKFLMNWPTTDVNITSQYGHTFLAVVRLINIDFSDEVAIPGILDIVQKQFLFRQWREIEEMLAESSAQQVNGDLT